ncbi:hypothetical protein D3C85_1117950 [compost metagenome]
MQPIPDVLGVRLADGGRDRLLSAVEVVPVHIAKFDDEQENFRQPLSIFLGGRDVDTTLIHSNLSTTVHRMPHRLEKLWKECIQLIALAKP